MRPTVPAALMTRLVQASPGPIPTVMSGQPETLRIVDSADAAEVFLYDVIGPWGISSGYFISQLGEIDRRKPLCLRVNSPGGDVFDGIAILNALRGREGKVTAVVDGLAASAASFIVQGADEVIMGGNSEMMIHNANGSCFGEAKDMRTTAELLDKISANIAAIYAERSGIPSGTWSQRMDSETWYSAEEAVAAGLADTVSQSDLPARNGPELRVWDITAYGFHGRRPVTPTNSPVPVDPARPEPGPSPQPEPDILDGLDLSVSLRDLIATSVDAMDSPEDLSDTPDLIRLAMREARYSVDDPPVLPAVTESDDDDRGLEPIDPAEFYNAIREAL